MSRITIWRFSVFSGLSPAARNLLTVMCDFCDPLNGETVDPEHPHLVQDLKFYALVSGLSSRAVIRHLGELEAAGLIRDSGRRWGQTRKVVVYTITGADHGWDVRGFREARQEPPGSVWPTEELLRALPAEPSGPPPGDEAYCALAQNDEDVDDACLELEEEEEGNTHFLTAGELNEEGPGPGFRQIASEMTPERTRAEARLRALARGYAGLRRAADPGPEDQLLAMEDLLALGEDREMSIAITLEAVAQQLRDTGRAWLEKNNLDQRQAFLDCVLRFMLYNCPVEEIVGDDVAQADLLLHLIWEDLEYTGLASGRTIFRVELATLGLLALGFDIDAAVAAASSRIRARLQVIAAEWEESHPEPRPDTTRSNAVFRLEWANRFQSGDELAE